MEQFELGAYYYNLSTGDRGENLRRSMQCYTEVLRFVTPESNPSGSAMTQYNLGTIYFELPTGDRATNLAWAIDYYTEALRSFTAAGDLLGYARTLNSLGVVYSDLPTGDRSANLARAIDCYTEALRFRTAEADPSDYGMTQHNLGAAYADLPTGDRSANVARAIDCFTEALRFRTAEADPLEYSNTQNGLGNAYLELRTGDRSANVAWAIECFTEALRFCTAEAAPSDYAMAQNSLGNAYLELPTGDRSANVARAIDCFTESLRFFTAEVDPSRYAIAVYNLGDAYADLPTGDRSANLARAIECYTEALRYRTAKTDPLGYAMIQNSLGAAYASLPTGDRSANLARAIECYTEALRFYTAEAAPFDYARTEYNLGAVYADLPDSGEQPANLARAIECYTEALRFFTAEADPLHYAATQNSLGIVYSDLPTGDRSANLARAIQCFTEALRFYTAEAAPSDYAMTQNNLAVAYADLPGGERAANLARATECFTQALRFFTAEVDPVNCRGTSSNLGDIHLEQDRWEEAHTAYSAAIRAGELLYQATGSEAGRQAELEAGRHDVAADAYCLARLGRLAEAVQRLEAGRARALGEALARDRAALHEVDRADRAAFTAASDRIRALEVEGRRGHDFETPVMEMGSFAERSTEIIRAREDLASVIQRIRTYRPGFMGEGLDYSEVADVASPTRPLVYLLITSKGGLALLVPAGSRTPAPEHAVWFDGFTTSQLNELLVKQNKTGDVLGGYLKGQATGDIDELAVAVPNSIEMLRRELLVPLASRLNGLGVAAATVVPVGLLSLLPLPAAAPEDCTIALAPSARVLRVAGQALRERTGEAPVLLAVGNPLPLPAGWDALTYAGLEVRAIGRFFAPGSRRILPEEAATGKAVADSLPGATHLHLACHGGFDLDDPLDSALYLADGDRLTLRDLLDGSLDLSSQRLAVLSACQTGITEFVRVPDEVIGLPAGFLQGGVPGVVATLWPVNDRSTALLVGEFYRSLLVERQDPASALGRARRFLCDATAREFAEWFDLRYDDSGGTDQAAYDAAADLRSRYKPSDRPYAHPVYWAGFIYSGA